MIPDYSYVTEHSFEHHYRFDNGYSVIVKRNGVNLPGMVDVQVFHSEISSLHHETLNYWINSNLANNVEADIATEIVKNVERKARNNES